MCSIRLPSSLLFAGVLLLGACSRDLSPPIVRSTDSRATPRDGGSLRLATFVRMRPLDPATAFDESSIPILRLIFSSLFRVDRNGRIVGELVRDFRWQDHGTRLVAELHHGIRMHDGSELTASDVKRSIERTLHPKTPCPAPSFYDHLQGYQAYRKGKSAQVSGIVVTGRYSFELRLISPDAAFLPALTLPLMSPVCASAGNRFDPRFARHPCGAGPFEVRTVADRDKLTLHRFEGYFHRERIHLERITWLFGVRTTTQRFRFERGDVDLVHELSASDSVAFRMDPRWKPWGGWNYPRSTRGIFMNTEMPPFNDVRIRRAVAYAIDRKAVASLRAGHLLPSHGMIPRGVVGFDPGFHGQQYDWKQALKLMEQAGYPYDPATGKGGYPHEIDYLVAANSFDQRVAELFQQQLARIGLRIRIRPMSWPAYLALSGRRHTTAMGADGWSADFDDPSDFLDPLFSTAAIQDENSQNRAFFSNRRLDELLAQGRKELDPSVRRSIYRKAQSIVRDQAPWAIVYGYRYYDVWQPYVHGYRIHPHQFLPLAHVWVDPEQAQATRSARGAPPGAVSTLLARLSRRRP